MRDALRPTLQGGQKRMEILSGKAPCNPQNLAAYNSYGDPAFVVRGYYVDVLFQCASCRKQEVWTATQQKWWYEVAKGSVESRAKLCNPCRKVERERKAEARRIHLGRKSHMTTAASLSSPGSRVRKRLRVRAPTQ